MKDSAPEYLVDAGPLIALLNRRDRWHLWAEQTLGLIADQLWTSEVVLAEACHNLGQNTFAVRQLLAHVVSRHLCILAVMQHHASRVADLMGKYEQMDLGDASLVVLSEQFPLLQSSPSTSAIFPCSDVLGASHCH